MSSIWSFPPKMTKLNSGMMQLKEGAASLNTASIHKKESMKKLSACVHSIRSMPPFLPSNLHKWSKKLQNWFDGKKEGSESAA